MTVIPCTDGNCINCILIFADLCRPLIWKTRSTKQFDTKYSGICYGWLLFKVQFSPVRPKIASEILAILIILHQWWTIIANSELLLAYWLHISNYVLLRFFPSLRSFSASWQGIYPCAQPHCWGLLCNYLRKHIKLVAWRESLINYLVYHKGPLVYVTAYSHCILTGSKMQIQHNSFQHSPRIICSPDINTDILISFFFFLSRFCNICIFIYKPPLDPLLFKIFEQDNAFELLRVILLTCSFWFCFVLFLIK